MGKMAKSFLLFVLVSIVCVDAYYSRKWRHKKPDHCPSENSKSHVCQILVTATCKGRTLLSKTESDNGGDSGFEDNTGENSPSSSSSTSFRRNSKICGTCARGSTCTRYSCYEKCCKGYERTWMYNKCRAKNVTITCQNGGTPTKNWRGMWTCNCPAGYKGNHCEIGCRQPEEINCENGGSAIRRFIFDDWICVCTRNYTGHHCETGVNLDCTFENNTHRHGSTFESDCNQCDCRNGMITCSDEVCEEASCESDGRTYEHGESFLGAGGCNNCTCINGQSRCTKMACHNQTHCEMDGQTYEGGVTFLPKFGCGTCRCYNGRPYCERKPCPKGKCAMNGHIFNEGDAINAPDGCNTCTCKRGHVRCTEMGCPPESCEVNGIHFPHGESITNPDGCGMCTCDHGSADCPYVECPPESCEVHGIHFPHGESITNPDGCGMCTCDHGSADCPYVECSPESCEVNGIHFPHGESITNPDGCGMCTCDHGSADCPYVECPPDTCEYDGRIYHQGEAFDDITASGCKTCTCDLGHVHCMAGTCPPEECIVAGRFIKEGETLQYPENGCTRVCGCLDGKADCTYMDCLEVGDGQINEQTGKKADADDDKDASNTYLPVVGALAAILLVVLLLLAIQCHRRRRGLSATPGDQNPQDVVSKKPSNTHNIHKPAGHDAPSVISNASYASVGTVSSRCPENYPDVALPPYNGLPPNPPVYSDTDETVSQYSFHLPPEYTDSSEIAEIQAPPIGRSNPAYESAKSASSESSSPSGKKKVHRTPASVGSADTGKKNSAGPK